MQHVRRTARIATIATAALLSVMASPAVHRLERPRRPGHGAAEDCAAVELSGAALTCVGRACRSQCARLSCGRARNGVRFEWTSAPVAARRPRRVRAAGARGRPDR